MRDILIDRLVTAFGDPRFTPTSLTWTVPVQDAPVRRPGASVRRGEAEEAESSVYICVPVAAGDGALHAVFLDPRCTGCRAVRDVDICEPADVDALVRLVRLATGHRVEPVHAGSSV